MNKARVSTSFQPSGTQIPEEPNIFNKMRIALEIRYFRRMKKKRLFNTSEYKTLTELKEALEGTGFSVYPEMQLKNVMRLEKNDKISRKERNTLNTASFDFVVYSRESLPEFVVEFDGPHHSVYDEKRRADLRKNRLCVQSDLPLLRIDDSFLTKYEEISFLKFVVERFVAWKNKKKIISQDAKEHFLYVKSSEEIDYDDPWHDPTIIFNLDHPFPASVEIAVRLFKEHQIITTYIDDEIYHEATSNFPYIEFRRGKMGEWPISSYSRRIERTYLLEKNAEVSKGQFDCEKLHDLNIHVDYKWGSPTLDRNDDFQGDRIPSVLFQGIPGTSMSQVADHFCDYLALSEIEKWAKCRIDVIET